MSGQQRQLLELLFAPEQPALACLAAAAAHGSLCHAILRAGRAAAERWERRLAAAELDARQRDTQLARALQEAAALSDQVQASASREATAAAVHANQVGSNAAPCPVSHCLQHQQYRFGLSSP